MKRFFWIFLILFSCKENLGILSPTLFEPISHEFYQKHHFYCLYFISKINANETYCFTTYDQKAYVKVRGRVEELHLVQGKETSTFRKTEYKNANFKLSHDIHFWDDYTNGKGKMSLTDLKNNQTETLKVSSDCGIIFD